MGFTNDSAFDPVLSAFEESGYLIEFLHLGSGKNCIFPAWITDFSDSFNSDWSSEKIFGRNDPIGSFSGTSRSINLSLKIPSFSLSEARQNLHQLEHLVAHMYPSYNVDSNGVSTISSYPLVKVKFANLIKNANYRINNLNALKAGLACWINSINFTPDLEAGFHHPPGGDPGGNTDIYNDYNSSIRRSKKNLNKSHTFIPKTFDFQCSLQVVHEHKLGWNGTNWMGGDNKDESHTAWPYGAEQLSGKKHYRSEEDSPMLRVSKKSQSSQNTKELMKKYNKILGSV